MWDWKGSNELLIEILIALILKAADWRSGNEMEDCVRGEAWAQWEKKVRKKVKVTTK